MKDHTEPLIGLLQEHFGNDPFMCGAEIGVWTGKLSRCLLGAFPRLYLYMIDPWESLQESTVSSHGRKKSRRDVIAARLMAEEVTKEFEPRATILQEMSTACRVYRNTLEFVFIDANHSYESVKADIEWWLPAVRRGGIICGHDYSLRHNKRRGWGVN